MACNDGNACTQTDTCQAGVCVGGNPVVCTASDQCHNAGVCDPVSGVCSNPPKPNDAICNDGNACTQTDTCQNGTCIGGNPVVCTDNNVCTTDSCNPVDGTCVFDPVLNGIQCQTASNATGACTGGKCCVATHGRCIVTADCCTAGDVCASNFCMLPQNCNRPLESASISPLDSNSSAGTTSCFNGRDCVETVQVHLLGSTPNTAFDVYIDQNSLGTVDSHKYVGSFNTGNSANADFTGTIVVNGMCPDKVDNEIVIGGGGPLSLHEYIQSGFVPCRCVT